MLKIAAFRTQTRVSDHLRVPIHIIDAIQSVQSHCIPQKVIALESGIDQDAAAPARALNIVQKNSNDPYRKSR